MKILLVDPPGKNKGLNTGLGYLSAVLHEQHDVKVLDLNNIEMGRCGDPNPEMSADRMKSKIIAAVENFKPQLFGVSVKTFTADVSKHIFRLVNEQKPGIKTVAGGPHITLEGNKFVKENRIDFGIQGEGEYSLPKLCNSLQHNGNFNKIEGLYYWKDDQLVNNPRGHTINNLDAIPFPRYDNFSSVVDNHGRVIEYPLLTSRGCPYKCSYCSMPEIMGGKWRSHTPERVIDELKRAKELYHSKSFSVVDDNFTLNLKRVGEICEQLVAEKINLPWNSQNGIRADRIDGGMAKKMKESGCHYVWIGVENADEEVFKTINKGENIEDIKKGIKHLKNAGIRVGGFFIVGLPHSTREADLKSVAFAKELGIEGWWFNFVPYPHTRAWDWVHTRGKVLRQSNGVLQFGSTNIEPVFETPEYPRESRIQTYDEIHIKMKYFDRLADPSINQLERWKIAAGKVAPFGLRGIFFLLLFILKFNFKILIGKLKR